MRIPNRIFSANGFDFWANKVLLDWESRFPEDVLLRGRKLYKSGVIRSVELKKGFATLITQPREERYFILEWDNEIQIRSSHSTDDLQAFAVAGLYEIEALLAEYTMGFPQRDAHITSEGLPQVTHRRPASTTKLALQLSLIGEGLRLDFASKENVALDHREHLVRLSHLSRKAGFFKCGNGFLLSSPYRIWVFVKQHLPKWKMLFDLTVPESVEKLLRDPEVIRIQLDKVGSGLSVQATFLKKPIDSALQKHLLKAKDEWVLLPGHGIVRLAKEDQQVWQQLEGLDHVPLYLSINTPLERSEELEAWQRSLLDLDGTLLEKEHPLLRPYQIKGVRWIKHLLNHQCGALLADEMGLGKTAQILGVLSEMSLTKPVLLLAPATVVSVWETEAAHFYPTLNLRKWDPTMPLDSGIYVTSYSQARRSAKKLQAVDFQCVILDEAQCIKNPKSKIAQVCCLLKTDGRIALTGTPIENALSDIWSLFHFLMPGLFHQNVKALHEHANRVAFQQKIAPFVLRRTKKEVLRELPEKVEIAVPCFLSEKQQHLYSQWIESGKAVFGNTFEKAKDNRIHFFALLTRLRQIACDPGLVYPDRPIQQSAKWVMLEKLLCEGFQNGHKVLIFSQFLQFLLRLKPAIQKAFPKVDCFELNGKTLHRKVIVDAFQNHRGPCAFLISLKTGGTGITLNTADSVILLDSWWNPFVEQQAIDRAHRIGQKKKVFVYRLIATQTIEDNVYKLQHAKSLLSDAVIGNLSDASLLENHFPAVLQCLRPLQNVL
ncbi:MAG: hypothetical protein A2Y14_02170 [Verrucomicrobia bacterium GWF2_51_19]|nr:MAG: hypothetical protein A2Y14_02170 [Verrucomicrobia bacterium GWF2_51_19]